MSVAAHETLGRRRDPALRHWALWRTPKRVVALVIAVDSAAVLVSVAAIFHSSVTGSDLLRFGLLAAMSVAYLEVSRQVEQRRRLFLTSSSHINVTSVWTLPAAVLLPQTLAVCLVVLVYIHLWFRAWRHIDSASGYRSGFSAAGVVITCVAVSALLGVIGLRGSVDSMTAPGLLALIIAIAAYPVISAVLVATAIFVSTGRKRPSALIGSWSENALELATLGLGGVTAALIVRAPWLALIVLPAVFMLQHHALIKQLVDAATIDTKTELLNASAWRLLAERELERAERQGTSTAVLVIDMDRFKQVNDVYGHLAGDTALKAVAEALSDELRGYDAVGRFGGEEFVALLPGVGPHAAGRVGERIRQRIASLAVSVESRAGGTKLVRLTASIGIASASAKQSRLDDLLRAADDALYMAKDDGRNSVRLGVPGLSPAS
jgi:diguanylate cyclase (GGDEF)-like protein